MLELRVEVAEDLAWALMEGVFVVFFPKVDESDGGSRLSLFVWSSLESFLSPLPFFKSFDAEVVGTFGVLTGSIGELVRDLEPKNLEGFSMGLSGLTFGVVSNLARPLATAPVS